ncbi:hypothetical protein OH686_09050 [Pseudomonas sp. SO81]|nr:hypothetical protein OH686_09050 [Pseudomonas sp. SO81]
MQQSLKLYDENARWAVAVSGVIALGCVTLSEHQCIMQSG